jgi:hypothetical protein
MKPDRAWVRLGSGRRLDLVNPQADSWTDSDLAVGLSRTYRWGGHSWWDLPLTVAQHSLLVLVLRQQMQPHQPLTPGEALRELLHDADEGFLSFDPIAPIKPHLGDEFNLLTGRIRAAIAARYALPEWRQDDHVLHKRADHLAAASEALYVAGWQRNDIADTLGIHLTPLRDDPLPLLDGLQPWEPWPARRAAALFLAKLRELDGAAHLPAPADLTAAVEREATLARLGAAFSRLPPRTRARCAHPLTGSSLSDTFVFVEADDIGQQHLEGVIVDGERDEHGQWVLDGEFTVFTTEETLTVVNGWCCTIEIQ